MPQTTKREYQQGEDAFQSWYAGHANRLGLNPNPDDPKHYYDYRAAYRANVEPDVQGHWPSQYKLPTHPNRYVGGIDTITGKPAGNKYGGNMAKEQSATEQLQELYDLMGRGWEATTIPAAYRGWKETAAERYPSGLGVIPTLTPEYGGIQVAPPSTPTIIPTPPPTIPKEDGDMYVRRIMAEQDKREQPSAIPEEADMYVKRDKKGNIIAAQDRPGKGFKAWKPAYPEQRIGGFTFYGKDFTTPVEGVPPSAASTRAWETARKLTSPYPTGITGTVSGIPVDFGLMGYEPPTPPAPPTPTSPEGVRDRINQISMEVMAWGRKHEPNRPFMKEELEYRLRQEGLFPYYQQLTAPPTPPPGIEDIARFRQSYVRKVIDPVSNQPMEIFDTEAYNRDVEQMRGVYGRGIPTALTGEDRMRTFLELAKKYNYTPEEIEQYSKELRSRGR